MRDGMYAAPTRAEGESKVLAARSRGPAWRMRRTLATLAGACAISLCGVLIAPVAAEAVPPTGITGTVTNSTEGAQLEGVNVCALQSGTIVKCELTNAGGEYTIEGLAEGEYEVSFSKTGFRTRRIGGVEVESGKLTEVDESMAEEGEGSIAGTVTAASTGQPIAGINVCVYSLGEKCTETAANGTYTLSGLQVGYQTVYFASAEACEEELGVKIRCNPKVNYAAQEQGSIRVRSSQTTTVNAAMAVGGEISGVVTNASITHPGIGKVEVCATHVNGKGEVPFGAEATKEKFIYGEGCSYTNAAGQYAVTGLATSGSYKLEFNGYICTVVMKGAEKERECHNVYVTQYYSGQQTFKSAGTVAVTLGANTGPVNESLRETFPVAPSIATAPALTGAPSVGSTLSCSPGSWAHEPLFLVYQWLRDGAAIAGQSGSTYVVQSADEGHSLSCTVQVGNGAGLASATSNALAVRIPIARVAHVAKVQGGSALVKVSCPGGGSTCSGGLKLVATHVVNGHARKLTVGTAHFTVAAGKTVTVHLHISTASSQMLSKSASGKLSAALSGSGVKAGKVVLELAGKSKKSKHHK
jgi:Carboxypeptidase regulatory-like domain